MKTGGEGALAELVLAECHGQVWLVNGDEYIDDVLNGRLPEGVSVEYITLPDRAAVIDMWMQLSPEADESGLPWMINPALLGRLRGVFNPGVRSISFAAWSVLLDGAATATLTDAATWLASDDTRRLRLRQFALEADEPGKADLQRLRGQLVLGALTRAGVAPGRVTEETVPTASADDGERVDVIEETGAV